jgi:hypothetical protein
MRLNRIKVNAIAKLAVFLESHPAFHSFACWGTALMLKMRITPVVQIKQRISILWHKVLV